MGHTEPNGGSKKESCAWAAESQASAVTFGEETPQRKRKRPGSRSQGRFCFCGLHLYRLVAYSPRFKPTGYQHSLSRAGDVRQQTLRSLTSDSPVLLSVEVL